MSKSLNLRKAARRASNEAPDPTQRIDTLIRTAKANWFGLLSYLAFVGVTLMGVSDADFFILERETALPLIGVSIPTSLFFYVAPLLGAALYVHLHVYLLKLWKALADAPDQIGRAPLAERTAPWIIADMALLRRPSARHDYPLADLAGGVGALLVFWGGPLVLAFFWFRSLPKHDALLTVGFIGLPLIAAVYSGLSSWRAMRRARGRLTGQARALWVSVITTLFATLLSAAGWMMTESIEGYDKQIAKYLKPVFGMESGIDFLYPANLAGVDFVGIPPDWKDYDTAERDFRRGWCKREGIAMPACGWGPRSEEEPKPYQARHRLEYCKKLFRKDPSEEDCAAEFAALDAAYIRAWRQTREAQIGQLQDRGFSHVDLRRASLYRARLEGVDLRMARLERASLIEARLEGANLRWARLEGALLGRAQLEGADLREAQLDGAILGGARLEGADLGGAQLEGAILSWARLEGADLGGARLEEADLGGASMDNSTNLTEAKLRGAAVQLVDDMETLAKLAPFLPEMFGDGSVKIADDARPAHWPDWELPPVGPYSFRTQWKLWLSDPENYTPPPKPAD